MATPAVAPATKSTSSSSSRSSLAVPPSTASTSRAARRGMAEAASASGASLADGSVPYDFLQNLEVAEKLLQKGNNEAAQRIFREIAVRSEGTELPETSLFLARCLLGIAYSYPEGVERTNYAAKVYTALNKVYAYKPEWEALTKEELSSAHLDLRSCFKRLRPLIPAKEAAALEEVDTKISECSALILPLDQFHEKVKEADAFFNNDKPHARKLYEEALLTIEGRDEIDYVVARAPCLLKLIGTCAKEDAARAVLRNTAQEVIFNLYNKNELLCEGGKYTKEEAFRLILGYLRLLRTLTPMSVPPNRHTRLSLAIQTRIDACKKEVPEEFAAAPTREGRSAAASSTASRPSSASLAPPPAAAPTSPGSTRTGPTPGTPPKKVTPVPSDGSWGLGRIFFALVFIAAIAAAGVALYRRHIVKVS
ncbi:MAG TPA: hypothetical protein VIJ14_09335 [Rhabdochlamydiaceae bacterium]